MAVVITALNAERKKKMTETKTQHEMLNVREACVLMRMSDSGLYGLVKRGVLPKPVSLDVKTTAGGVTTLNHWRLDDLLDAKTSGKIRPRKKYAIGETGKRQKRTAAKEAGIAALPQPTESARVEITAPVSMEAPEPMTMVHDALDVTKEHVEPVDAMREVLGMMNRDRSFMLTTSLFAGVAIGAALVLVLDHFV
jgi:predicted DNA-binding transcriptional regulator AlpA